MNKCLIFASVMFLSALAPFESLVASSKDIYKTSSGFCFEVDPVFRNEIAKLVSMVRNDMKQPAKAGKFIAYLSVPISPRGGGRFETNVDIAAAVAKGLQARFGEMLWVLNPAAYNLPNVDGNRAGGGEYMAVWGDVLGGTNGDGREFALVYFVGPGDVWSHFGTDNIDVLGDIENWISTEVKDDQEFAKYMKNKENYRKFLLYYGLRAASSFSKGAHDEWNIIGKLNRSRKIGDDISVYFDGRAVEMSDFLDETDSGYAVECG